MQEKSAFISVIITTYNWPEALQLVLLALNKQTDKIFEVIVADDGSSLATKELITNMQASCQFPIIHVWQEDLGFRAAKVRNKAIAKSKGEYIIFLDHDCIPRTNFIQQHRKLMEKNFFVAGGRILLSAKYTKRVIQNKIPIWNKKFWFFLRSKINGNINRCLPMLCLPLGWLRKLEKKSWQRTKNLIAIWKDDLISVNGYNEEFIGWGYEDTEMVVRIIKYGKYKKLGKFATDVIHLHHPIESRENEEKNMNLLQKSIQKTKNSFKGLSQYL